MLQRIANWVRLQLSIRSLAGILMLVYAFIPDNLSRLSFWAKALVSVIPRASTIPQFFVSGFGRLAVLLLGISIIGLDHRRVLKQRSGAPASPPLPPKTDLAVTLAQCWVEDGIVYAQVTNNAGAIVGSISAQITYCDAKGRPYRVLEGIWKESGQTVVADWRRATLMLGVTTDEGSTVYAPTPEGNRLIELNHGKGFVSVRLFFNLYGNQPCDLPPLLFSVRFSKEMRVEAVNSIPGSGH
jgi:hypothetical protein